MDNRKGERFKKLTLCKSLTFFLSLPQPLSLSFSPGSQYVPTMVLSFWAQAIIPPQSPELAGTTNGDYRHATPCPVYY
jgi:hypothetical protein